MQSFTLKLAAAAVAAACILPGIASASGGGSGPNVQYAVQGKIGEVITNPYKIAPLTAVIRNGGYQLKDAAVRIVPKHGGAEIKYNVSDVQLRTHAGIPVFGLYPDYNNTVEVSYTIVDGTKETRVENEVYRIYTPGIHTETNGTAAQHHAMFETEVKKVAPEFKDRLYFINNFLPSGGNVARTTWNNPMGGALEWVYYPQNAVIDTAGDVRWYMFVSPIYDPENIYKSGIMMGFHQADDGFLTFGYGQRYAKYDLMGREVFNRRLPVGYADFSHAMDPAQNGHYFLRVSSADYRRPDGKRVHTVRDVILEVDQNGCAVDDFRLFDILDPYRDNVIKAMDQGAVCLNVDATKSGQTLSAEELAKMDTNNQFGDIAGVGPGRNWAHVNSVAYDESDDSIIISARHQGVMKIGRDKEVKWILAPSEGWKNGLEKKLLKPVDKDGRPLKCSSTGDCEGGFDFTYTQHAAWPRASKNGTIVVFDNGQVRHYEQPALPEMNYSRVVEYKIDPKTMTVKQTWAYGKDRGYESFAPITSNAAYQADKDTMFGFYGSVGLFDQTKGTIGRLQEVDYKTGDVKVEIDVYNNKASAPHYQGHIIDLKQAFAK